MKLMTPFDHFWKLFLDNSPRVSHKPQCMKKFNSYCETTQRVIYKDVSERLQHYDQWKEKTHKGKRQYMPGPYPYLNSSIWLDPSKREERVESTVRDTTNEKLDPEVERRGLIKLRDMMAKGGHDTSALDKQLEKSDE